MAYAVTVRSPTPLRSIIEKEGVEAALQFEVDATRKYTPQHFFDGG